MKKISFYILFLTAFIPSISSAQLGQAYEMMVDGVKVIVQPSGNEIVEIRTIIKGGVQNYPAAKAGIEALALSALTECGTLNDDKNSFKDKLDKVSAQVDGSTGMDFATIRMNCIKGDFETVWPLYIDAITKPKFEATEFQRIKEEAITAIKTSESNPDNSINKMARQTAFAGKNYAKDPQGTIESLSTLTAAETKKYYQSLLNRGRIFIVVVGELNQQLIEEKIKSFTSKLAAGKPFISKKEIYLPATTTVKPKEKEFATNYIQGIAAAPLPGTPDYNAFALAMRIFSDRHYLEVRSKNGLSYAPAVWLTGGLTPYANIFVTTTDPNKYIAVTRQLIDKTRKEGFKPEELKDMKTTYVTGVYYQQETNSAQAGAFASNEVIHNNWRRANTIKDDVKKITAADLTRVFNKYMTNITWSYQGNPKQIDAKLYTQKETPPIPKEKKAF